MDFIDANYILRYLLRDNPKQFFIAKEIIENREVIIQDFILAEVVYVLEKVYVVPRKEIKLALEQFLAYPNIGLSNKNACLASMETYVENKIDFADALLIAYHKTNAFSKLHTFDKKILKLIST